MRAILIVAFTFFYLQSEAQKRCFTVELLNGPSFVRSVVAQSGEVNKLVQQGGLTTIASKEEIVAAPSVIRIPVVVHILYNNPIQNISDDQVKSQILALNRDFRKRNSDTLNIPGQFKSLASDVEIEFGLAVVNPKGAATNGIVRKQTSVKEWIMDDKIKFSAQGGDDAWDSKSYLNIWVGTINKTLGYSSLMNGPAENDGIVISNKAFGTIGISGPYNMGRTLVHETGHWLGLKHIWGDATCGDDEVDDTPKQAGFTTGCPTGFRATCGTSTSGDMYMNYMDFTNDGCMCLFTKGQKERMRSFFLENNSHYALLFSKGLDTSYIKYTAVVETPAPNSGTTGKVLKDLSSDVLIYPNPATSEFTLKLNDESWIGREVKLMNMNGMIVQKIRIISQIQIVSVAALNRGIYFLMLEKEGERIYKKIVKTGINR